MGASTSKNVSKMMQKASINISTSISQSSATGASASNMVTQVCSNVRAEAGGRSWANKKKLVENQCYGKALNEGGKKACAVPFTRAGDSVIVYTNDDGERVDTSAGSFSESVGKLREASARCSRSETNCGSCSNGEGRAGVWSNQSYERCAELFGRSGSGRDATTYSCAWSDTPLRVRGKSSHCVPKCRDVQRASECSPDDGCVWRNQTCEMKNPADESIDDAVKDTSAAVGCRIRNINQSNSVKAVARQLQDAAVTNVTQQQLTQNLKQVATAMTSGINFGNFSAAENLGEQVANAETRIKNSIKQKCGRRASPRTS